MSFTSRIKRPYWESFPPAQAFAEKMARGKAVVLEIGPGVTPFPLATDFVDWIISPKLAGKVVHRLDINTDRLPYADKSVDFVYCRHTLEDLCNPFLACEEMNRIAKSGFIETPSPIAELCRGVDGGGPPWRGCIHHRHVIWTDGEILKFVQKAPVVEYLTLDGEERLADLLNLDPLYWSTYFAWSGEFKYKVFQHDRDFQLQNTYAPLLATAANESFEHNQKFRAQLDLK